MKASSELSGSFLFSALSKKFGNIQALLFALVIWIFICTGTYRFVYLPTEFYLVAASVGLVMGGATLASWGTELGYWVLTLMLGGGALLAFALSYQPLMAMIQRLLARFALDHSLPGIRFAFAWPTNIGQAIFAVGIHCFNILALGFCLKAYGADVPTEALMIGLPALSLLLMLPISISGWGLREATLASVLALWGVSPSLTVLGSISYGAITLICVLPGAYQLLKRK
ncbi:MAG: UPF0104 family protein [Burkholderiaceae bacterium]|nr:UPF0104 family protein [Burkholderiaceae bacterium]